MSPGSMRNWRGVSRRGPGRAGRSRRVSRGVSDVVATIILLALTVVLFAGIFTFVTSFPSPPSQSSNQFQATLFYSSGEIAGVNITHLAGPQVPGTGQIYVKSAHNPTACYSGVAVSVASGISTPIWTLGETWHGAFSSFPGCSNPTYDAYPSDNLTIFVISNGNLLFSAVLPGQPFLTPPTIVSTWTSPSPIGTGSAFKIFVTVAGNLGGHKPYANLAGLPGQSGPAAPMWFNATNSAWQTNVTGVTTAGTYHVPINVTGPNGLTTASAVTVSISTTGGSSTSPTLSVTPSIQPAPPFVRLPETLVATVTNSGSSAVTISSVNFWVNVTSPSSPVVGPISGTITQATVNAYSSVVVLSSSTWLPASANTYNLTARAVFSNGAVATQWNSQIVVGQPFTISVSPSPARVNASSSATFAIVLSNDGPLSGTTANVSLYIVWTTNGTHGWSTNGKSPVSTGQSHGGWWVTNASTTLGPYATLFWTPALTSPAGGPFSYTITVSVTLTNSAWTSTYTLKAGNTITG